MSWKAKFKELIGRGEFQLPPKEKGQPKWKRTIGDVYRYSFESDKDYLSKVRRKHAFWNKYTGATLAVFWILVLTAGLSLGNTLVENLEKSEVENPYELTLYSANGEVIETFCSRGRPYITDGAYRFRECETNRKQRITGTVVAKPKK